jgi:predicted permease
MLAGIIARLRSFWRGVRRRSDIETDMNEEFRSHIELRANDLERAGLSPSEATRRARLEFGSTERYKDEARESRGLRRVDQLRFSWLDVKLGFRMLVKYPVLTIVGGLAMAFAILVGAGAFELVTQNVRPRLPLPEGDRIVALQSWDASTSRVEPRALHDFVLWREELRSVVDLGAFRDVSRNLITDDGLGVPITVAEISASAFRLTRVPPLLGRHLSDADEDPGAPLLVVIGYDAWQARFAGDSAVVGRTVRLGGARSTVVGVMPDGFAFPARHSFWAPLRLNVRSYERRAGPGIRIFGRLAPGVTLDEAEAELAAVGRRTAADFPDTHQHLRPQVMPYAQSFGDPEEALAVMAINLPAIMLLMLVCANVALLMFARAATREGEIIVRTALGASRGRIVMQLFAEALVLGSVAALVGLSAAGFGLRWVMGVLAAEMAGGRLPFWMHGSLSPATVLYACALTVLGAVIAGVVPALKVTRGMGAGLKQATAGGGGLQFGGIWTAVIISQVAITVAFPAVAFMTRRAEVQIRSTDVGVRSQEYLSARLELNREATFPRAERVDTQATLAARFATISQELRRRLMADPAVSGVTFANVLPRMHHPDRFVAVDEGDAAPADPRWPGWYRVQTASVDREFFDVLGAPILSGRDFHSGDLEPGSRVVIVNQSFATLVFGARDPIGRRIRYARAEEWNSGRPTFGEPSQWHEIVGVVRNLGLAPSDMGGAGFYLPVAAGGVHPAYLAVHVRGDPVAFAPRLRAIAGAVDPALRLYDPVRLDRVNDAELRTIAFWFRLLLGVSGLALTLSLAGIYAVMAFTVARRTREIGIRVALGANPRRVVVAIFRRPLAQVALGVATGMVLVAGLVLLATDFHLSVSQAVSVVLYAALMLGVCLLACVVPTRRALRVEPTEALKAEG